VYGGFISTYTFDFKPTGAQDKFIVTQARHTWTTAKAAEAWSETPYYLQTAKHGFRFSDVQPDVLKFQFCHMKR
jgi:mannobiose 2-epimerase